MNLQLTTEQVNQILNALAQQPYIQVHELIDTIQQQGQAQLDSAVRAESRTRDLSVDPQILDNTVSQNVNPQVDQEQTETLEPHLNGTH